MEIGLIPAVAIFCNLHREVFSEDPGLSAPLSSSALGPRPSSTYAVVLRIKLKE